MPRLSIKARLKQKWFRFKKWARWKFGPKPKLPWDTICPQCRSEVLWSADTRVEGTTIIALTEFRCVKCGWRPPEEGDAA
jgi:hypothetical protein